MSEEEPTVLRLVDLERLGLPGLRVYRPRRFGADVYGRIRSVR